MSKAKTASKNNPTAREQAREYMHNGKKIKPVKLISERSNFLAAEYDDSGDLVLGKDGNPLPWQHAKSGN